MKKRNNFLSMLLIAGLLNVGITACDKTDELGGITSTGTMKDADGNMYNTVKIGNQIWMAENLKTTKYNDGTPIPNIKDNDEWTNLTTGAYCNYDNLESNLGIYGRLYNWYAVETGKLAPKGWHVPTDDDWTILINYLIDNVYEKGENTIAKALCAKTNWELSDIAGTPGAAPENNNSTGFTALPGGSRSSTNGTFNNIELMGYWWSSTEYYDYSAFFWGMTYTHEGYMNIDINKEYGFSVRLIRD